MKRATAVSKLIEDFPRNLKENEFRLPSIHSSFTASIEASTSAPQTLTSLHPLYDHLVSRRETHYASPY